MAKKNGGSSSGGGSGNFTDTARVKALIALMADNGLTEIELVEDKSRIVLRRGGSTSIAAPMASHPPVQHVHPVAHPHSPAIPSAAPDVPKVDEGTITIKSPMVGTFYAAPNPDSDAYVSIGTDVEKDKTVVCVIEAMKVFNEIHADATGTVTKILVSNGQTVEYGQPLFLLKPN
jgi:acetyl-CoA carboxylase biotin carboxyl carrier protein